MESNPASYSPVPVPSQTPNVDEFISEPYTNGDMRNQSPIDLEFAKTSKEAEVIRTLIGRCTVLGSNSLDLSHKGLTTLPRDILELKNLEYLYLEGNELNTLPDDIFDRLPNLKWLDLRQNYLVKLPSVYTGRHENLRNLLLEGNNLRSLPLELGLITSLNGLNITNNPLEFPPQSVIEKGTRQILQFLREMLAIKANTAVHGDPCHKVLLATKYDSGTNSSDDWEDRDADEYTRLEMEHRRRHSLEDASDMAAESLRGPIPHSAELHKPRNYIQMRQQRIEKLKQAGALGTVDNNGSQARNAQSMNLYPSPPATDFIDRKMMEERKLAKQRELKEKQDAILQRRNDENMLKDWRDQTKRQQQKKYREKKGSTDFIDPVKKAPFAIDNKHMKVMTNEERIKQDVKMAHEKMKRPVSPASRRRIEEEKAIRINELERRIKQHTAQMHERRRRPKGNPQDEMQAAMRELEIAELLKRELMERRKGLEYRFKAFIADMAGPSYRIKNM